MKKTRKKTKAKRPKRERGALNVKRQAFVDAYIGAAKGNAAEAARLAGFKGKNAHAYSVIGDRLLASVGIRQAIDERLERLRAAGMADAVEVHTTLTKALRLASAHLDPKEGETPDIETLTPLWQLGIQAAAHLAKILGMTTKKVEIEHTGASVSFVFEDNGRGPTT